MSKDTIVKTVSPLAELRWVTIIGEGKENMSGAMQYKVDLVLDPQNNPEHKAYIDLIDAYWAENKPASFPPKKKPKSLGYYFCDKMLDKNDEPLKDEDTDKFIYNPKGKVSVSFKTAVAFPDGSPKKVKTRNSKGAIVELGERQIGNGSMGYIAGAMDIYRAKTDAGVTLYLDEIKLIKFIEFEGANNFGDDTDDEEGWTGEDEDAFVNTDQESKPRL